jgi:ribosomal-protein-alanine N-acetyltransferase
VITLRAFEDADLDGAFALDQVCFPVGIAYSKAELRYFVRSASAYAIVAEKAGDLAGFLVAERKSRLKMKLAHIVTIDVEPTQRRSGVATRLMDAAESHYHAAGCLAVSLEVAVDNMTAQNFYSKRNFQIEGRRTGYYNGILDAFTMSKMIAGR